MSGMGFEPMPSIEDQKSHSFVLLHIGEQGFHLESGTLDHSAILTMKIVFNINNFSYDSWIYIEIYSIPILFANRLFFTVCLYEPTHQYFRLP